MVQLSLLCFNIKLHNFFIRTLAGISMIIRMKNNHIFIDESGVLNEVFILCFIIFKNKDFLNKTIIQIENFKNKTFQDTEIELHFNKESFRTKVRSVKYIDSKKSQPIQLADMRAGCIRRKFERNTKEDNELFGLIKRFMY